MNCEEIEFTRLVSSFFAKTLGKSLEFKRHSRCIPAFWEFPDLRFYTAWRWVVSNLLRMLLATFACGNHRSTDHRLFVLLLVSILPFPQLATADLVKLINGGELRGKIIASNDSKQKIRIETMTGATVVVDRSNVQFVTPRSLAVEEYETKSRCLEETADAHWDLAEWCRQRGLAKQREMHLRRVTELAPDHEKAQSILGRVWHQGGWIDRDELMASQGYVKYKNKYITPQELEVIENTKDELDRERSWFQKIRLWHGWLDGQHENRRSQAMTSLNSVDDPNAAPAIMKFLATDSRTPIRELAVSILVKISGSKSITGLVKLALFDEAPEIRTSALNGIGNAHYERAQKAFVTALKNESNTVVCRAAMALGQIGDKEAVKPLIEALVTVHQYQVAMDLPNNQTYSFSSDGSFSSNSPAVPPGVMAAVRTGQLLPPVFATPSDAPAPPKKTVTIRIEHYNADTLAALGKLTQQNFGYDKRTWQLWWAAEKNAGGTSKGKG